MCVCVFASHLNFAWHNDTTTHSFSKCTIIIHMNNCAKLLNKKEIYRLVLNLHLFRCVVPISHIREKVLNQICVSCHIFTSNNFSRRSLHIYKYNFWDCLTYFIYIHKPKKTFCVIIIILFKNIIHPNVKMSNFLTN